MALMATWEITITCRNGSRLRFSELRGHAPRKGKIVETADAGKIIKARIDASREERAARERAALFPGHGDRNIGGHRMPAGLTPRRFPPPWTIEDTTGPVSL
jgi:hypothetical protein